MRGLSLRPQPSTPHPTPHTPHPTPHTPHPTPHTPHPTFHTYSLEHTNHNPKPYELKLTGTNINFKKTKNYTE